MRFDIITIFPESLRGYFSVSILGRAQKSDRIKINLHNLRDFAEDKHKKTDDNPFGGGPGMVMKIEPIALAIGSILKSNLKSQISKLKKTKIILFSPSGKQFTQKMAKSWAKKYDNLILICGRYEGVDERVKKIMLARREGGKAEEISIGPYILTGGELPAAVVADAVARHIPNVLGKEGSLEEKREMSGFPVYTKPEFFEYQGKKYNIPKILLSGHHEKIKNWRTQHSKKFFKEKFNFKII
ncbi:MAG: tRNA (guanosine(37)-N1)-methyltransferase TrmD [Candidatus Terrybacteria bacterium RIFCSPLOWO2_02_42_20]|uniref:tRNA (guanine-N(1)-)-methyltransferase n=2 Tax=Candidatus Terryibacteriota TaxID=1817920 RepID=A0A1G2PPS6_9BACT|nr:MAG: tRNA (guanosine(37)-N1)-methyltransferase TrmD [Candidatus Terrybacteria bacterium RIFCSPHIGHO2_02_41_19]OHA53506.1 MAG: tRNA (guanosine(37)-N1)-methyltransferase TrmD [Candidatus Terrybacteria bacterium RIFCSPLOWO2_02_42_20]